MIPTNGTGPGIDHSRLIRLTLAYVAVLALALAIIAILFPPQAGASEFHCPHDAPKSECYIPGEYEAEHEHDNDPTTTTRPATTTQPTFHDEATIPTTKVIVDDTIIHTGPAGGHPNTTTSLPSLPSNVHVNGFVDLRRSTPPPTRPGGSSPTTVEVYNPHATLDQSQIEDRSRSAFAGVRTRGQWRPWNIVGATVYGHWWQRIF